MVIPELIRLLQERGILMDEAVEIVSKVCAYTNHTILAEALEKWPIHFLLMILTEYTWLIWISIMDTVSTVLHTFTQRF